MSVIYQVNIDLYSFFNRPSPRGAYVSYPEPSIFFGCFKNTTICLYVAIYRYGMLISPPCGSKTYILLDSIYTTQKIKYG